MSSTRILRRDWIRTALAAGVASLAHAAPLPTWSKPVRLGVIGTGSRGTSLLQVVLQFPGVEINAVCDVDASHAARAVDLVQSARRKAPARFTDGPEAYRRLLEQSNIDAVLIASPEQTHAPFAAHAVEQGKAVLSEVAGTIDIDAGWKLVDAVERTGQFYMMAENCCYYRSNLAVLAMARAGLFGDITYADCGYIHSLPDRAFDAQGNLTWRGELFRDYANWYPTHAIGPVAQWMGIHRGDRFDRVIALQSPSGRLPLKARELFGADSKAARTQYRGDCTMALIQTVQGRLIELRFDGLSARPTVSTTYFGLQGTRGAYRDAEGEKGIWFDTKEAKEQWLDFAPYQAKYDSDLWKQYEHEAASTSHGGADFFTLLDFFQCVAERKPSPITVYDAVAWSSLIPLTTASAKANGTAQTVPDFTRGKWKR